MNIVLIMTDTQSVDLIGAYGNSHVDTPNLDRLAREGVLFRRAYTTCPLCTPARAGIFTGTHPPVNGSWCNNVPPYDTAPMVGTIFRHGGYRAGYTGKWHLDGSSYFGDGVPGGGFEPDWWYDGKRYAEDIGPEMFKKYKSCRTAADLRAAGFTEDTIWGHRVADRAIDFLERVGQEPFVLGVSFDEPHGPFVAPPEYWEKFSPEDIPWRLNKDAPLEGKPRLQQVHHGEADRSEAWHREQGVLRWMGCNSYIDREIGRVVDAVDRLHRDDTLVIYTSDHGDMMNSHGLRSKGPMMYEEIVNIPLIVRMPGGASGVESSALVSHLDLLPTMLDVAGLERPESLHGESLRPALEDPRAVVRETAMVSFTRFAINHDGWGGFYPIRCATDGRFKLAINLFETDEFYDLETDPYETANRIDDPDCAEDRDRLHDALLEEMDRTRDPFRTHLWGCRPWRCVREPQYWGGTRRDRPEGFSFQPSSIEATGAVSGAKRPGENAGKNEQ